MLPTFDDWGDEPKRQFDPEVEFIGRFRAGNLDDARTMSLDNRITYTTGDLFTAPEGTVLVHACNTVGSWGAGIALAFRDKYPAQFEYYKAHCKEQGESLLGTCLLIPGDQHDIACLFTSKAYGKRKDRPHEILAATKTAVEDLMRQNTASKALHAW